MQVGPVELYVGIGLVVHLATSDKSVVYEVDVQLAQYYWGQSALRLHRNYYSPSLIVKDDRVTVLHGRNVIVHDIT